MRNYKFGYLVPIALVCLVVAFPGYSQSAKSMDKTTLTLWWNVPKAAEDNPFYDEWYQLINTYEKTHPGIQIKTQSLPYEQLKQKLTNALLANNPPDLAAGLNTWLADFYRMNALPNLTQEVKNWPVADHIYDSVWSAVTINNEIVAFPWYIGVRATLYHQDALKKAGISEPPQTWEELFNAVPKLLKVPGVKYPYGIATDTARGPQELVIYLWGNNVSLVRKKGPNEFRNVWQSNSEALKRATEVFAFYQRLLESGAIGSVQASWSWRELDQNLVSGSVAIAQDGSWMKQHRKSSPKSMADLKVGGVPVYKSEPVTYLEVAPVMTFKKSEHREAAIDFMKWVQTKEAQMIYARSRSPRKDVVPKGQWGKAFSDLIKYGRSWPPIPLGRIRTAMADSIQRVLLGASSPRETAIWLAQQINQSLKFNGLLAPKKQ